MTLPILCVCKKKLGSPLGERELWCGGRGTFTSRLCWATHRILAIPGKAETEARPYTLSTPLTHASPFLLHFELGSLVLVSNFPALELIILSDFWQQLFLTTFSKPQCPINSAVWTHTVHQIP